MGERVRLFDRLVPTRPSGRIAFHPAGPDTPVIEARGITVEYGGSAFSRDAFRAIDAVDLTMWPGRSLGLVGESGCGKTTLGRSIVGLTPVTAGTISIAAPHAAGDGPTETASRRPSRRLLARSVQMVFQDPYSSLDPRQRIRDAIAEPMVVHGIAPAGGVRAAVDELLGRVGLDGRVGAAYPHELSGGQRQRVCIARALSVGPQVVVCDEPTSALDVSIQAQVVGLLRGLQAGGDITYLFITHDLALLPQLVADVAVMYLGRIIEVGPAAAVLRRPRHPYTTSLVDSVPTLGPSRRTAPRRLQGEAGGVATEGCRFRSRCWRYAELGADDRRVCDAEVPPLVPLADSPGHSLACHHVARPAAPLTVSAAPTPTSHP